MDKQVIVMITDFHDDYYAAVMEGVILSRTRNAHIVNVHLPTRYDIVSTSWALLHLYMYYPKNTVFLIVVDPGVGSSRLPIVVYCDEYFFVVPDNGIVSPIIEGKDWRAISISYDDDVSNTFHGRDIFAPTAAKITAMMDEKVSIDQILETMGPPIRNITRIKLNKVESTQCGNIVYIDVFGNLITNIIPNLLKYEQKYSVKIAEISYQLSLFKNFEEGSEEDLFLIVGSCGTLEIVSSKGSAATMMGAKVMDEVLFHDL